MTSYIIHLKVDFYELHSAQSCPEC